MVGVLPSIVHFYPRPPRGGRRPSSIKTGVVELFLSTPSARRATIPPIAPSVPHRQFLSTPSARRATVSVVESFFCFQISIHALREEGDVRGHADYSPRADFYPRPPRGGRPRWSRPQRQRSPISIHALREEGDRLCVASTLPGKKFLSTPSARRATFFRKVVFSRKNRFLSTPSARRATFFRKVVFSRKNRFLSTPSARRATGVVGESCVGVKFLSTPSARRATWKRGVRSAFKIFLSTPSARRATSSLHRH